MKEPLIMKIATLNTNFELELGSGKIVEVFFPKDLLVKTIYIGGGSKISDSTENFLGSLLLKILLTER